MEWFTVMVIESQMPKSTGMKIIYQEKCQGEKEALSHASKLQEKYPSQKVRVYKDIEF